MDRKKFEAWLTEIAHWHRPLPADLNSRSRPIPDDQRQTGCEIQCLKDQLRPCEWCTRTCSSHTVKRWFREQKEGEWVWRGYCDGCRRKYDPATGRVGTAPYVKKGRAGSPRAPAWWAPDSGVILGGQDPAERRAELLDRLAALKRQDK
jgi:hypothetical protein